MWIPLNPGQQSLHSTVAWRPDARASLSFAAAAMALVVAGFAALFSATPALKLSRDVDRVVERLLLAAPTPAPPPRHTPYRLLAPVPKALPLQTLLPPMPTPIVAPSGFAIQDYMNERAQQDAAVLRGKVTAGDLQRDMSKTAAKPALADSGGYRTVTGQKIVRTGDNCAQIQTVQGSSSPTNRAQIAEPTDCPAGSHDASREMGKALDEWGNKVHQAQAPPP